jgi:16S rRNA uridine-516 pseudouridylate synthase and related pseudouridylate synthases
LSIVEGRYHQVKRMFGHFDNKVLRLHRECMGPLVLDDMLKPGEYRSLSSDEIRMI